MSSTTPRSSTGCPPGLTCQRRPRCSFAGSSIESEDTTTRPAPGADQLLEVVMSGKQSPYSWTEAEKDLMEGIDTTVPHSARIWNYWLGGKDNYPVHREAGDQFAKVLPGIVAEARANRQFLARPIHYLVTEANIRQFLDIGTGLPTVDNTHEVSQRLDPACRIVYVDNDPLVLAHAR